MESGREGRAADERQAQRLVLSAENNLRPPAHLRIQQFQTQNACNMKNYNNAVFFLQIDMFPTLNMSEYRC